MSFSESCQLLAVCPVVLRSFSYVVALSCLTKVKSTMVYDDVWEKVSYCIIMHLVLKIKVYDANIKCRVNL